MNPVLLKPEADHTSQVVLMGRPILSAGSRDYYDLKPRLWESVSASLDILRDEYDIVVIEGAGSPAEINLKATEIVNMRVARYAQAPVLLCADIDRGGEFAAIVGTLELLEPEERDTVKGFVINKFRGDISLLTDGLTWLEERTGTPVVGVVNYFRDIHIPEEDSVALDLPPRHADSNNVLDIAVVQVPHISNFDDFDPLARESSVTLRYVNSPEQLGAPDLVVLPGTKTTIADLAWMEDRGLADAVRNAHRAGSAVIGICGGYQMLGTLIQDPDQVESSRTEIAGLGLLPQSTVFSGHKETHRIRGLVAQNTGLLFGAKGAPIQGYEIHMGRTVENGAGLGFCPAFSIEDRSDVGVDPGTATDGALDSTGWVLGSYIHGLFQNSRLRQALLQALARRKGASLALESKELALDQEFDKLADWVRSSLKMDLIYDMTGLQRDFEGAGARP